MEFDPANMVVKLCAKGMELEAHHQPEKAKELFVLAWHKAANDFEKFTAAHYVARHQPSVSEKLNWDKTALEFALKLDDKNTFAHYPSLYLNIAKCYEDLNDLNRAYNNYQLASSYTGYLPDDGYGRMIKAGIENGLTRTLKKSV